MHNEVFEKFKIILEKETKLEIEVKTAFSNMDMFVTTTQKIEVGRRKAMMEKILNSSRKCYFFKQYVQRINGGMEHLLFYLDVNEFYNMFSAMRDGIYIYFFLILFIFFYLCLYLFIII